MIVFSVKTVDVISLCPTFFDKLEVALNYIESTKYQNPDRFFYKIDST